MSFFFISALLRVWKTLCDKPSGDTKSSATLMQLAMLCTCNIAAAVYIILFLYVTELEDTHEVLQILAVSYLVWRSHRQKNRVANILRDDLRADMILWLQELEKSWCYLCWLSVEHICVYVLSVVLDECRAQWVSLCAVKDIPHCARQAAVLTQVGGAPKMRQEVHCVCNNDTNLFTWQTDGISDKPGMR